jgi:hypothetical protein
MSLSLLSPHTFSLTWEMIDLFLSTSEVSLARVSFSTMDGQDLMEMHSSPIEQEEMESKRNNQSILTILTRITLLNPSILKKEQFKKKSRYIYCWFIFITKMFPDKNSIQLPENDL